MNKNIPTITLPESFRAHCGFNENDELELHASEDAIVIIRKQMTAMELVNTIDLLQTLSDELIDTLINVCGICGGCDDCFNYEELISDKLNIPEYILEEAGISKDDKLEAFVDEPSGAVIITVADYLHDITDVPGYILDILDDNDVCLAELDEALMSEVIVYGG